MIFGIDVPLWLEMLIFVPVWFIGVGILIYVVDFCWKVLIALLFGLGQFLWNWFRLITYRPKENQDINQDLSTHYEPTTTGAEEEDE